MTLETLQQRINYVFNDLELLKIAFTHRSVGGQSYERLEFLGDNILGMIISEHLYKTYPNLKEGKLSRMRAHLVRSESLLVISRNLELYEYIIVRKFKGVKKYDLPDSLIADIVESLIGAIYLDSDYATIQKMVLEWFTDMFSQLNPDDRFKDAKTALQERLQSQAQSLPVYNIERIDEDEEGNAMKVFIVTCQVESYELLTRAKGTNKKIAEQASARKMLGKLHLYEKENMEQQWDTKKAP